MGRWQRACHAEGEKTGDWRKGSQQRGDCFSPGLSLQVQKVWLGKGVVGPTPPTHCLGSGSGSGSGNVEAFAVGWPQQWWQPEGKGLSAP